MTDLSEIARSILGQPAAEPKIDFAPCPSCIDLVMGGHYPGRTARCLHCCGKGIIVTKEYKP